MEEPKKLVVLAERVIRDYVRPIAILASVPMLASGGLLTHDTSPDFCVAGAILAGLVMISYSLDRRATPPT